ncbi:hypothetical protein CHS0354_035791 [Potamilus streckersoni]|uniref:Zinc-binding loop region of homing endonuclease domain-containing protein n=1 Tax=Potamilus streckersoni TaxID=2493646 RepID=A0AAE0SXE1_9BIVA|nr:hypothetical protein CHS0354_035791 [Potamilus streckersoni]
MSDIYNSSFKAFYGQKLLKSISKFRTKNSDSSSNCTVWKSGLDKDGYPILKKTFKLKRYNLRVQRLLYYLESPLEWLDPKFHVSHLCHNKQCLNLEHLSYEPAVVNSQRNTCVSEGRCFGHKPFRNCLLQASMRTTRNHFEQDERSIK